MAKFLQPNSRGFRHPTNTAQMNGEIYNPPRMNMLGGLDKINDAVRKNNIVLKKPGQTIAK